MVVVNQFRRRFFDMDELPKPMAKIADLGDVNVTFVPGTRARYFEYAPLFHLQPKRVLDMFGLPLLRGGQWPFMADWAGIDDFLQPISKPGWPAPGRGRSGHT